MHRANPADTSIRAFAAGGSVGTVNSVKDSGSMQTADSGMMKGERRKNIESPQNYGFTSVCSDGDKDDKGNLTEGPESHISFMGGNRSFPICNVMDDPRHRLKNLAEDASPGAVATFGQKKWGQQTLNCEKGMYMTGNTEKEMKFQLVENKNKEQEQQGGQGGGPLGGGSGGGDGGQKSEEQKEKERGQVSNHKQPSTHYVEMTKDACTQRSGDGYQVIKDKSSSTYYKDLKTSSTTCTDNHAHLRFKGNVFWASPEGLFTSTSIMLLPDSKDADYKPPDPVTGETPPSLA